MRVYIEPDPGVMIDVTDKVRTIFRMEVWPYSWDEWLDNDQVIAICEIGMALGIEDMGEKRDAFVAELERRKRDAEEAEARAVEYRRRAVEEREQQRRNSAAMAQHLMTMAPILLARHQETVQHHTATNPGLWR